DDAEAPRLPVLPDLPGQRALSARQGAAGVDRPDQEGQGGDVRLEAPAGVLAELEPDRAAVEVPAQGGFAEVAPDVRGDATGDRRRAGQLAQARAGPEDANDRTVPSDTGGVHHSSRQRRPLRAESAPATCPSQSAHRPLSL